MVEQPLPWPADVSEIPELIEVARLAASAKVRLQAVAPAGGRSPSDSEVGDRPDRRRVLCYLPAVPDEAGGVGLLVRYEAAAEVSSLVETVSGLLEGAPGGEPRVEDARGPTVVDVLVCTHGRRDTCCGGRGMDLVGELVAEGVRAGAAGRRSPLAAGRRSALARVGELADSSADLAPTSVRLWRTSHTGGHRFAPTCIVLPSATMWAWADPPLVRMVAANEGALDEVQGRYRGYACLGSPPEQALEAAVLAEVGWPLLGYPRWARALGDGRVQLETEGAGRWDATVREGRRVPQPDCRTDPAAATRFGVEWVVEDLRQVVAA